MEPRAGHRTPAVGSAVLSRGEGPPPSACWQLTPHSSDVLSNLYSYSQRFSLVFQVWLAIQSITNMQSRHCKGSFLPWLVLFLPCLMLKMDCLFIKSHGSLMVSEVLLPVSSNKLIYIIHCYAASSESRAEPWLNGKSTEDALKQHTFLRWCF